ncbi:MAG: efflux RND transporter periplasmic adaptor subunit, partial [Polyangiaceae bacterium]
MNATGGVLRALALTVLACASACGGRPASRTIPPASVEVVPVVASEVAVASEYLAQIRARDSAVIFPLVGGTVTRIYAAPGDAVRAGDPLVQIDARRQRAMFQSSAAGAKSAEAELFRAQSTLHQLDAQHAAKAASLRLATAQSERDTRLVARGAISPSAFDESSASLRTARADADGAAAAIVAQEAAVEAARRAIAQARENARSQLTELTYYRVVSPIDGVVGDVPVTVGAVVTPSTRLTSVAKNAELDAYVAVPVERARDLHVGQRVDLLDSAGDRLAET